MGNETSKKAAAGKKTVITATTRGTNRAAVRETTVTTVSTRNTNHAAALPSRTRRLIQNFLLVWLDADLDESKVDFKNSLEQLRNVVAYITIFKDVGECIQFLNEINQEKISMIVSGLLGRLVVPDVENMTQIQSIDIFCGNKTVHEEWSDKISKVKGVYTEIELICKALQIDSKNCDRAMVSITFKGIDPLFMYTQLLKETILQIEDDDTKSLKELADYCRNQKYIDENEMVKLEKEYRRHTPLWWYTAPHFLYSMLNRGLRLMDTEIIIKSSFFMHHLQKYMDKVYWEQHAGNPMTTKFSISWARSILQILGEYEKKAKVA